MAGKKQFDMEAALDAAMVQFWRTGYAGTSVDDVARATGLNRSSIYSSLGDKDTLFVRCLDRYAGRYGDRYDAALASARNDPRSAIRAFFDVTLDRIADPRVPDGCLIAQSVMAIPSLSPAIAERVAQALEAQRQRVRSALRARRMSAEDAETFAEHIAAVNQSLAVMSRGGASAGRLRAVVDVTLAALGTAPPADQEIRSSR